ncbi:MAG: response regulator [Saonia sp.]
MRKKLNYILLLDDNPATNFIHKKFIREAGCAEEVIDFQSGYDMLDYLKSEENPSPELIFIDINMPIMNAWEFLEEYEKINEAKRKRTNLIMLTTSLSPGDVMKAKNIDMIKDIRLKPLSVDSVQNVVSAFFPDLME